MSTAVVDEVNPRLMSDRSVDTYISNLYGELRQLASVTKRGERRAGVLQTTELLHEAYLRLMDQRNVNDMDESTFRASAAIVMRRILVDQARAHRALKRGSGRRGLPLDAVLPQVEARAIDLIGLDEALVRLSQLDARKSRVVELRFFGGLTVDETAAVMRVPRRTVERDWTFSKAWLRGVIRRS